MWRRLCEKSGKTAGVTTGALYKRFAGKEALFEALLAPTLQDLKTIHSEGESFDYEKLNQNEMHAVWDMSEVTLNRFMDFLYDHYDGFKNAFVLFRRFRLF